MNNNNIDNGGVKGLRDLYAPDENGYTYSVQDFVNDRLRNQLNQERVKNQGLRPLPQRINQEQYDRLSFNPAFEDVRARMFRETPDQQKQRLNQKVIDYMRFKMQNPNFLFNNYIDDEIRDINNYKQNRLIT